MALKLHQLVRASEERQRREERQERQKFLFDEYLKFGDIKDFAEYFHLSVDKAIYEITQGRVLRELGL